MIVYKDAHHVKIKILRITTSVSWILEFMFSNVINNQFFILIIYGFS